MTTARTKREEVYKSRETSALSQKRTELSDRAVVHLSKEAAARRPYSERLEVVTTARKKREEVCKSRETSALSRIRTELSDRAIVQLSKEAAARRRHPQGPTAKDWRL